LATKFKIGDFFGSNIFGARATPDSVQQHLSFILVHVFIYYIFYGSGFTTLIRFNYWILCETVLPGQGDVPRLILQIQIPPFS
jgi:hypothetical protein